MTFILITDLSPFYFIKAASLSVLNFRSYATFCCSILDIGINPFIPNVQCVWVYKRFRIIKTHSFWWCVCYGSFHNSSVV